MLTLACDIGGTSLKVGVMDGHVAIGRARIPVDDRATLGGLLPHLADTWKRLLSEVGRGLGACSGVGVAFPGIVDARHSRVVSTNKKFDDAPSIDFRAWAKKTLGLRLSLDNDARAALIGEWQFGAGRGFHDVLMVTLGTGIGAAAVVDDQPLRGYHGMGGAQGGHLTIDLNGPACTCGGVGCVEAVASTDRLAEVVDRVRAAMPEHARGVERTFHSYEDVFISAERNDALACAVRDFSVRAWSVGVTNLVQAYGSQCVVLGGGIAEGAPWIVQRVQDYVDRYGWTPWGQVAVRLGELGSDAALIGCGVLGTGRFG